MSAPVTEFKCAECRRELNLGDARSTVLRLMEQRRQLLEALVELSEALASVKIECSERCFFGQPNNVCVCGAMNLKADGLPKARAAIALAEGGEK